MYMNGNKKKKKDHTDVCLIKFIHLKFRSKCNRPIHDYSLYSIWGAHAYTHFITYVFKKYCTI